MLLPAVGRRDGSADARLLRTVHVGVVTTGIPNPGHGGGSLTAWSFVGALLNAGHRVTAFALLGSETEPRQEARVAALEELGGRVVVVPPPPPPRPRSPAANLGTLLRPPDELLFPALAQADALADGFREAGVDAGLVYGTDAVAAAHRLASVPLLALMGDPPGLSRRIRLRYEPLPWSMRPRRLFSNLSQLSYAARVDRRQLSMLRRFPSVGMLAAHHAERARRRGVNAWYAPLPIVDLGGPDWEARRKAALRPERLPRILMIGHLRGIATISGLHIFVDSILPALSDALGPRGCEVRIVGGYEPPPRLRARLENPALTLTGQIEPPDEEFLTADVQLVPTPIKLGSRSRILTGMSFGACVVAHEANRLGIPELAHETNALLAPDGPRLAEQLLRALADEQLRLRLGRNARRLYETTFTPEIAGRRIVGELERVAGARQRAPEAGRR